MGTRRYTTSLGQRVPLVTESEGAPVGGVNGDGVQLVVNFQKMRKANLLRLLETVRMHITEGAWPAGGTPTPTPTPTPPGNLNLVLTPTTGGVGSWDAPAMVGALSAGVPDAEFDLPAETPAFAILGD